MGRALRDAIQIDELRTAGGGCPTYSAGKPGLGLKARHAGPAQVLQQKQVGQSPGHAVADEVDRWEGWSCTEISQKFQLGT